MHVVLVSACEKRALKRTRAVLDSYAMRTGTRTWLTPITQEGLAELRAMLRRNATRQTSVACFRNDGRAKMTLLWIVGNKNTFDRYGFSPLATRAKRNKSFLPEWARVCATIAGAAGHMHDLGKYGVIFQEKLKNTRHGADDVRHEWISLMLVREMLKGATWEKAWKNIGAGGIRRYDDVRPFDASLSSASDVLLYIIGTHHRLPREDGGNSIGAGNHVRNERHDPKTDLTPSPEALEKISKAIKRVMNCSSNGDPLYWRAIATVSRMALILADHSVSAKIMLHKEAGAYANTYRPPKNKGQKPIPNQKLDWHLAEVGKAASEMVFRMLSLSPPELSNDTVERICKRAEGRYAWQNEAAAALAGSVAGGKMPHLVLNIAGTGSGKTRMNCRAACVLNEGRNIRIATALNLRTLTLQTRDSYARQLGIGKDELTCVIGDRLTSILYEYGKSSSGSDTPLIDDDENPALDEFDSVGEFEYHEAPEWLKEFTSNKHQLGAIIGSPILVSTIDFLIAAGEPHLQGNHALAALRVMTSDLILDEIDGYDPKPLLSVLRLVMMSAMFGRNVIASSATLSRPVASLLWRAYAKGAQMRERLTGNGSFNTAIIDDLVAPQTAKHETIESFTLMYEEHLSSLRQKLAESGSHRIPMLKRVEKCDKDNWFKALGCAVADMHGNTAWVDPKSGKKVSIGLVRMANIGPAIETAEYLAKSIPEARVACYHSNHLTIQRWHIEKRLDALLTRKNGDEHIIKDKEIRKMLDDSALSELVLIIVATPVEEIGRDHDFDWAIIEPSSSQSIVQTAGRVNRHRLIEVSRPNVAIMQYNLRAINNESLVFRWPGLEIQSQYQYKSHNMEELLDWNRIDHIDSRIRFDNHLFSKMDDESIERATKGIFTIMTSEDRQNILWMALETYAKSKLRDDNLPRIELALNKPYDDPRSFMVKDEISCEAPVQRSIKNLNFVDSAWLSIKDEELVSLAKEYLEARDMDSALSVSVLAKNADSVKRHLSFGFLTSSFHITGL